MKFIVARPGGLVTFDTLEEAKAAVPNLLLDWNESIGHDGKTFEIFELLEVDLNELEGAS